MAFYKTRQRPEKEMIFGIRAVIEAIQAGKDIDKILLRRDKTSDLSRELVAALRARLFPCRRCRWKSSTA